MLSAIREQAGSLPAKERELAMYVLDHPQAVAEMTIQELARRSGGSTATISRFCRSLGTESFRAFKVKLAVELAGQDNPNQYQDIVAGRPLSDIVSAITSNHMRSLSDTSGLLDLGRLEAAIRVLHNAPRIDLYGTGTSALVAADFHQKLIRIGKNAAAFADPHMQLTSAASLSPGDVAIGISYSGETPETNEALRCAAEQGAVTVSITRFGASSLAETADIKLFVTSLEAGMRRGDMASRIAQLHLIDMLFTGLVSEYFDTYVPRLERSYQAVRGYTKRAGRTRS